MKRNFRVEIAERAEADMRAIRSYIAQDKVGAANKWLREIIAAARSLRSQPFRCEQIPEAEALGLDCRHLVKGNYRIIFRVQGRKVRILRVIHAARQLTREMFEGERS
jgi:plasmid stabilization system protein ParE